jgi:hypothetical protein
VRLALYAQTQLFTAFGLGYGGPMIYLILIGYVLVSFGVAFLVAAFIKFGSGD